MSSASDPTREQHPEIVENVLSSGLVLPDENPRAARIQLSNALWQRDDARRQRDQAERRIADLEWVSKHRTSWIEDPLRQQVQVLQDRIAKVREIADAIECANCDHPAKAHKDGHCTAPRQDSVFPSCHCSWGRGNIAEDIDAVLGGEGEKADADHV